MKNTKELSDKFKQLQTEYVNACYTVGELTHKLEEFSAKKENALIKLRNLDKTLQKTHEELAKIPGALTEVVDPEQTQDEVMVTQ